MFKCFQIIVAWPLSLLLLLLVFSGNPTLSFATENGSIDPKLKCPMVLSAMNQTRINSFEDFKDSELRGVHYSRVMVKLLTKAFTPLTKAFSDRVAGLSKHDLMALYNDAISEGKLSSPIPFPEIINGELADLYKTSNEAKKTDNLQADEVESLQRVLDLININIDRSEQVRRLINADEDSYPYRRANEFILSYLWQGGLDRDTPGVANGTEIALANIFESTFTPVGLYGVRAARAMIVTTHILQLIVYSMKNTADQVWSENQELISNGGMARSGVGEAAETAPLRAFSEGVYSMHQLLTLYSLGGVPGANGIVEALEGLVYGGASGRGLTSEITSKIPIGYNGPLNLSGFYPQAALSINESGKIELRGEYKSWLKEGKEIAFEKYYKYDDKPDASGGLVCPMAACVSQESQKTGIQLLAESYFFIFNFVYDYMY